MNETFATGRAQNEKCNTIYRTCIAYIEGKINEIMWRCVFCAHKPYFLIPDHILISFVPLFIYEFTATMVVLLGLTITRRNFASTLPYGLIMLPIYVGHVIWQFPRVARVATYLMYPCNYAYSQIDHSNVCIYIYASFTVCCA